MINEVAYYLYQRGFYLIKNNIPYSNDAEEYRFNNNEIPFFEICIYEDKKTKEVINVTLDLNFDFNHLDELYYKQSFDCLIEIFNTIKKAINKFENDVIIPMCEKFNLIYDGDYFMYDKEYYFSEINKLKEYVEENEEK